LPYGFQLKIPPAISSKGVNHAGEAGSWSPPEPDSLLTLLTRLEPRTQLRTSNTTQHRARRFAPTECGRPLSVGLDFGHPEPSRDLTAETSGFSQVPGRTPLCTCPGLIPRGILDARPIRRRGDSLPLVPRRRLPDLDLSRLITTACTLAVYASLRRVTPTPRKTRFRWVANPCRVGFGPTGSTTKGFRFCLLHFPSSLPRLDLAQGTSSLSGSQASRRGA
jgi:hypothetical protein